MQPLPALEQKSPRLTWLACVGQDNGHATAKQDEAEAASAMHREALLHQQGAPSCGAGQSNLISSCLPSLSVQAESEEGWVPCGHDLAC